MLVHTDQLTKRYGAFTALDTFSLDVPAGEIFGLLGPNGAGKTTLLRLLLGYITPTSGTASVLGFDSVRQSLEVKTRTAYLPGEARLFRRMNGHRVLDFFAALRPGCRREVAAGVARRLDLDCSRQVARMSTGMRQKLALAVVLAMETPLMILDEPTANLDPTARAEVLAEQLAKSGRPVTPELEAQIKEEVINREIFMQEAVRRGLDASDEYKNQLELARQSILIRELFNDQQNKDKVTDADIKAEYDKFVAANGGKEYRARHILVEKEDQAKAIVASLKKGAKFEDLAKKQSKDPGSGANGGDLDWAAGGNYVKEFSEAMVALKKGQLTDKPVKTQFGWHVIRLDDVREAQLPKFEEVKPQISQQMLQQKMGQFQQDLRAKAKIE